MCKGVGQQHLIYLWNFKHVISSVSNPSCPRYGETERQLWFISSPLMTGHILTIVFSPQSWGGGKSHCRDKFMLSPQLWHWQIHSGLERPDVQLQSVRSWLIMLVFLIVEALLQSCAHPLPYFLADTFSNKFLKSSAIFQLLRNWFLKNCIQLFKALECNTCTRS